MNSTKILFVCMGNICRSPTAEGVFRKLIEERNIEARFVIDSAGTHAYHVGDAPDLRAQKAALDRGIDLSHLRARQVNQNDFSEFDLLLVMDDENYETLMRYCPKDYQYKVRYLMDYAPHIKDRDVPDPYYGGSYGFENVLNRIEAASEGILNELIK